MRWLSTVRLTLEELEPRVTPSSAQIAVPGPQFDGQHAALIFTPSAANAITVSDPAIGNGQDVVFVQVLGGTLTAANTGALGAISGNGSALVGLTGTISALNSALDGLTFVAPANSNGVTGLSVLLVPTRRPAASAFVPIDLVGGPIIHLPTNPSVSSGQSLTFAAANGNAITVTDPSNLGGADTVWIEVSSGTLALSNEAGIGAISGQGTSFIELTGTLAQINAALDGLTYIPTNSFQGQYLSISVFDYAGATPVSGSASTPINITAGSVAPLFEGPLTQEIPGTNVLSFSPANGNGITIVDPDAGSSIETMYLETRTGSLAVLNSAGLTSMVFVQSPYANVHYLEIVGTVPALNAALNGLQYQATRGTADDYLFLSLTDSSNAGVALNVQLTNYGYTDIAPTVTGPGFQPFTGAGATFAQANGNAIHIADGDANGQTETAYVQVAAGTLTVANGISLGVRGNGTSQVTITSTVAIINAALDGLHYTPAGNGASDYLNVLVGDGVRAGSLPVVLGPDTSATLAPTIAVPPPQFDYVASLLIFSEDNGNAIQLAAGDANGATESLVLQTLQGQLEVGSTAGLATISGNGSSSLYMTGTVAALNTALDGLEYSSPAIGNTDFVSVAFGNNGSAGGPTRYTYAGVSIALSPPPDNSSAPAD